MYDILLMISPFLDRRDQNPMVVIRRNIANFLLKYEVHSTHFLRGTPFGSVLSLWTALRAKEKYVSYNISVGLWKISRLKINSSSLPAHLYVRHINALEGAGMALGGKHRLTKHLHKKS